MGCANGENETGFDLQEKTETAANGRNPRAAALFFLQIPVLFPVAQQEVCREYGGTYLRDCDCPPYAVDIEQKRQDQYGRRLEYKRAQK